jgi:hypothetical protein
MMSASHDEAHLEVPKAHESVDSRDNVAGGRQVSPAELAQMEAAGYGFAQKFAPEAATVPGELLLPLLPGDRTAPHRQHADIPGKLYTNRGWWWGWTPPIIPGKSGMGIMGWGWTPDPRQIGGFGGGTPNPQPPIPGKSGMGPDGDGDRGYRALVPFVRATQ